MYNIEDKIKSWYKNNGWKPVVSSDTATDEDENKKKKEVETKSGFAVYSDEELKIQAENSLIDDYNLKKSELKNDLSLTAEIELKATKLYCLLTNNNLLMDEFTIPIKKEE